MSDEGTQPQMEFKLTINTNDRPREEMPGQFNISTYIVPPAPRLPRLINDWYGDRLAMGLRNVATAIKEAIEVEYALQSPKFEDVPKMFPPNADESEPEL